MPAMKPRMKKKGRISRTLIAINTIPLLLLSVLTMFLSSHWFSKTMYAEIETELKNVAACAVITFDLARPGDYHLVEGDLGYELYKGEYCMTDNDSLIDGIKSDTGFEVTLFYQDTRFLTTIRNTDGNRIIGTGAPETVIRDVLEKDSPRFYNNSLINGQEYFSFYLPLHNSDSTVAGMLFVGKPKERVDASVADAVFPILLIDILAAFVIALFNFLYNKSFGSALLKIHGFLSELSAGRLSAKLDSSVLKRNDELSDIGYSALNMQRSLGSMIEQDSLTGLYNRRFADRKLRQVIAGCAARSTPFCVAIGDIDFFKRVNDTYGHECGDFVLKELASLFQEHMCSQGFAARWGGEEFLLVYDHAGLSQVRPCLEALRHQVEGMSCIYEGQTIHITMTFGLTAGDGKDLTEILRCADKKLYEGKAAGRNRIAG